MTERKELIWGDAWTKGFERCGEDHCAPPPSDEEVEIRYQGFLKARGMEDDSHLSDSMKLMMKGYMSGKPYIEGAWMDKYEGKYYLQYAFPGTQYNVYGDGSNGL